MVNMVYIEFMEIMEFMVYMVYILCPLPLVYLYAACLPPSASFVETNVVHGRRVVGVVGVRHGQYYTLHCALYTMHCALYTVHWSLLTVHCALYCSVHYREEYSVTCVSLFCQWPRCCPERATAPTGAPGRCAQTAVRPMHLTVYSVQCTSYSVQCAQCTVYI